MMTKGKTIVLVAMALVGFFIVAGCGKSTGSIENWTKCYVLPGYNRGDARAVLEIQGDTTHGHRMKEHLCADKGYDYPDIYELPQQLGYVPHIKSRGQEEAERKSVPRYRARRWVVERTHSWLNRFRRILIRWEKKVDNYLGFLHCTFALIVLGQIGVFG